MLHDFLVQNFQELVSRAKAKASARRSPSSSPTVVDRGDRGIRHLLAQLREALREDSAPAGPPEVTGSVAARHARDLLEKGWSASEVVHESGDIRDAITGLAAEKGAGVAFEELGALGQCLDAATGDAVAAYARVKDEATSHREVERLAQVGHDLRTQLQTALLSFRALRKGTVDIGGSAGDALGRSLDRLRDLVDTRLAEGHLAATSRVSLAAFVHEVAVVAHPRAEHNDVRLTMELGDPALSVDVDPHLLASALIQLLQNAFKYTRAHGCVTLRTRREGGRAVIEVEDECGGLLTSEAGSFPLPVPGDRRASARSAPGRGLSSSRKAVQANGGEVHAHNLPGKGCIFGIQLPVAGPLGA